MGSPKKRSKQYFCTAHDWESGKFAYLKVFPHKPNAFLSMNGRGLILKTIPINEESFQFPLVPSAVKLKEIAELLKT
jgi:hypothetical protein